MCWVPLLPEAPAEAHSQLGESLLNDGKEVFLVSQHYVGQKQKDRSGFFITATLTHPTVPAKEGSAAAVWELFSLLIT